MGKRDKAKEEALALARLQLSKPITFNKATVLTGSGTDTIMLESEQVPCKLWPFEGLSTFKIEVAAGKGEDFVKKYFGLKPKVINVGQNHRLYAG